MTTEGKVDLLVDLLKELCETLEKMGQSVDKFA
jgi:hypothetical protein